MEKENDEFCFNKKQLDLFMKKEADRFKERTPFLILCSLSKYERMKKEFEQLFKINKNGKQR